MIIQFGVVPSVTCEKRPFSSTKTPSSTFFCSSTGSIRNDPYWTFRKKLSSLEFSIITIFLHLHSGTKTRKVHCVQDRDKTEVDDAKCHATPKPDDEAACNVHHCPPR